MISPRVAVEHASVCAGSHTLLPAVSFQAQPAETVAITGENGSGKTTLLRVLAGLMQPTDGRVLLNGRAPDERRTEFRASLAAAIGTPPLAQNLTVREHLLMVAVSWGAVPDRAEQQADMVLHELQIDALGSRFVHELSSGQLQLFTLALPLIRPFQVLVLDEPEQRLDPERLELVSQQLRGRAATGATLILATHSRWLTHALAAREVHLTTADR